MSQIDQKTLFDDIVRQANIVDVISSYINVERQGRNHRALCPFHDDKNPSLMISDDKQIFKCFVCGEGGNALTFVQKYEKLSYRQAAVKLANLIGYRDERLENLQKKSPLQIELSPYFEAMKDLASYYQYGLLTEEGKQAYDYLKNRGLSDEMMNKYGLGYALNTPGASHEYLVKKGHLVRVLEDLDLFVGSDKTTDRLHGRVIFPITDINGQTIGFSGRILSGDKTQAKYLNSSESKIFHKGTILFNLANAAKVAKRDGYVYLVEGFMDVFALDHIGINSAVALMGTAFSKDHIRILRQLNVEIRLALDGDAAGQLAMMKVASLLDEAGLKFKMVDAAGEKRDSDEIYLESGSDALLAYLNNLITYPEFALNYYANTNTLTNLAERRDFVAKMMPIIQKITSPLIREEILAKLASLSGFALASIKRSYENFAAKSAQEISAYPSDYHPERETLRRFTMAERYLLQAMIADERAITYYEQHIKYFYDDIYRVIAEYLLDYYHKYEKLEIAGVINDLQSADNLPLQEEVIQEFSTLALQKNVPNYSIEAMDEYKAAIDEEREEKLAKMRLENLQKGKSDDEKAQIFNDYLKARAKAQMMKKNSDGES